MTRFIITEELTNVINESGLDKELKAKIFSKNYITHEDLINFYQEFGPTSSLIELIKKTKLVIPNKNIVESKPKSKDFLESMEKLRLKAKEDEYQRLIRPPGEYETLYEIDRENWTPAQAHKEMKSQVTTIINILISVASVVYAIWYWTDTSWGLEDSYRVLLCIFFGLLILVAEVVVYMGYLNKIEEAKVRERSKKEVKSIVRTLDLNSDE